MLHHGPHSINSILYSLILIQVDIVCLDEIKGW